MNLTYHLINDEEKQAVCSWKYEGDYACYNQPSYEEAKEKGMLFFKAGHEKNFRAYYDGDTLVGFTNLMEDGEQVFLGIGVHPNLCSKGYGTAIVALTCRIAEELYPGKPLYLTVRTWNQRAIRCYEKCGFVKEGDVFLMRTYSGAAEFYRMVRK